MHTFQQTESEIIPLISKVGTNQNQNYFDHPLYDTLVRICARTTEMISLRFHKTDFYDHPFVAVPEFIPGFKTNFLMEHADILKPEFLGEVKAKKEFLHNKQWTHEHHMRLAEIDPFRIGTDKALQQALLLAFDIMKPSVGKALVIPATLSGIQQIGGDMYSIHDAVMNASNSGRPTFNSTPFQSLFDAIREMTKGDPRFTGSPDEKIIKRFFEPIIQSGKINEVLELPNWKKSSDAVKLHNLATKLGIKTSAFYNQAILPEKVDEVHELQN
jgi:hypothetical protein